MTPAPGLIDTHAHLADDRLAGQLPQVLDRARAAGVAAVVAVGTTAGDSRVVLELARGRSGVFPTVGIHPNHAAEAAPGDWGRLVALAADPAVVAIGETGLDRYWDHTPFPVQRDYFDRHIELAEARGLPIIIHSRDCLGDIIEQLGRLNRPVRGVLHSFTGNREEAQALLALGLHLSFAGMITFANKSLDPLREAAAEIPADRLLVETDSPYLSPHPFRGKTNEPARVVHTAARLAELRGVSPETIRDQTTANARALFGLGDAVLDQGDSPL